MIPPLGPARWPRLLRQSLALPLLLALMLLAAALPAAAAEEGVQRHGIFIDTLDVTVVEVAVVVLDRSGRPVTGLTQEDFRIFQDGDPVAITNFRVVERPEQPRLPGEAPDHSEEPAEVPVVVTVLVDDAHLSPQSRNPTLQRLSELLPRLLAAGPVLLARKDQRVEVLQEPTTDLRLLTDSVARLQERAPSGAMTGGEERGILRQIDLGADPGGGGGGGGGFGGPDMAEADAQMLLGTVQMFAQAEGQRMRRSAGLLEQFVASLSGVPGRKVLLYVGDGMTERPGDLLFRYWDAKYGAAFGMELGVSPIEQAIDSYETTEELSRLAASAAANGVAFYTLGAESDRQMLLVSAAQGAMVPAQVALARDGSAEGLRLLARETGGDYLGDRQHLEELVTRAVRDGTHFYSLGFRPPGRGSGRAHRLRVEADRPGVELRYINRYRDKTPDERMAERAVASLLLNQGDNPLNARVELDGEAHREGRGEWIVPLVVKVPIASLVLVPEGQEQVGQISLYFTASDELGRLAPVTKHVVPVRIPNSKLAESLASVAGYQAELRVREGEQRIAVGVRDDVAASQALVTLAVRVGEGGGE